MAYEFEEPFAALISSSAKHSATDLTLRKADSRVYTMCSVSARYLLLGEETYADGKERDGLVNSSEWRDIDSLATNGTLRTDTGGVLTRTSVDDSINKNLQRSDKSQISLGERLRLNKPGWGSGR